MSNQTPTALEQFFMMLIRSNGVDLPKRPKANFLGGTVADDPDNNQTLITLGGVVVSAANLLDNFTQPAVGADVVAHVTLSSGYQVGVTVFLHGGGFYTVDALPDSTHVTLKNTGDVANVAPGATVTNGVLVLPSGPVNTLVQSNGSPIVQRGSLDLEGFTYTDDGAGNRMKFVAAPTLIKTLASYTQPAIGASVSVNVATDSMVAHGFVSVVGGGRYTVSSVTDATHAVFVNRGGSPNVVPGTVIAAGAVASLQSPSALETLGAFSPFAVEPVNNIMAPEFGAVGDDVHDDTAAFAAAYTAFLSNGLPIFIPPPPVAFKITGPLVPPIGSRTIGRAIKPGQCLIRAHASMLSMFDVRSTQNAFPPGPDPIEIDGIGLDGNGLALDGINRDGDFLCRYRRIFMSGMLRDGFHARSQRLPLLLSAVTATVPGGSPAGVTISQPDLGYQGFGSGAFNVVAKALTTAARGTATFAASFDGGATFQTATQVIQPQSNLCVTSLSVYQVDSGVRIAFPAGTYHAGDFWSFTATVQNEDEAVTNAINADVRIDECWVQTSGAIYATNGLGQTGLATQTVTVVAGTVSMTAGSQIIQGDASTAFLAGPVNGCPRAGELVYVVGGGLFPVACVLDDHQIAVAHNVTVAATLTGVGYCLAIGAGIWADDGLGDEARPIVSGGRINECPMGVRAKGQPDGGMTIDSMRIENYATTPLSVGSVRSPSGNVNIRNVELKSGVAGTKRIYIAPLNRAIIDDPRQGLSIADFAGDGFALVTQGTGVWSYNSQISTFVPNYSFALQPLIVPVTSNTQQIAIPGTDPGTLAGSYQILQPSGSFVMSAVPTIPPPAFNGQELWLELFYNSAHYLVWQDDSIGSTGMFTEGATVLQLPGEVLHLRAVQFKWVQVEPLSRVYRGAAIKGSGWGMTSKGITTTNATPQILLAWDLAFAPTNGLSVLVDVWGRDTGSSDEAVYRGVEIAVSSVPAFMGPIAVASARGTNAGFPPAAWGGPSFVIASSQLQLLVGGAASTNIQWDARSSDFQARRVA